MQWVIKATKLCNLRCKYCYEWEHLSDPTRMSDDVWRHALAAIREYGELAMERFGYAIPMEIVWHGGEPLTLPTAYFMNVVKLQADIFPSEWMEQGRINNVVQTNLYSVSDEILDFFKAYGFELGVSLDFCGGVRLTAAGQLTEGRVKKNLSRLEAKGIRYGVITVLANHTVPAIHDVFDGIAKLNASARLLPLFGGSESRPMDGVEISSNEILNAMLKMFELWFAAGMAPKIDPFDQCVKTIVMNKLNLQRPRQDRAQLGNEVLVVDRDGSISCVAFRDSRVIGNVTHMRMRDVIESEEYLSLISEEAQLKEEICSQCTFSGACDTSPVARNFDSHALGDCPTEKYLLPMIEKSLEAHDFFDDEFWEMAQHMMGAHLQELTDIPHGMVKV